jgi:hypothetical protein
MELKKWVKRDPSLEERLALIAVLGRRRAQILESPELDLQALEELLHDYEAADLVYAAESLRKRLAAI